MKYEKAMAEIIILDNSDVVTGSNACNGKQGSNCSKDGGSPSACGHTNKDQDCTSKLGQEVIIDFFNDMNDEGWLG